ncbi:hypothetical protein FAZ15_19990 [Sphingobacterium olei]|uniref:Uncharacterized protein n=1 Tax=Sphingobacterium olei TaxID=2571155 RepID=A0A4U0NCT8_9SPHI|nr:hypothetical protein [Sphingobacterium olei]TJZ51831.1 hypothetical protein FAZ15_19990 [Sphingobacterium olei]
MDIHKIFNVGIDQKNVICPPDQVFARPEFEYLLTIGGDLVDDEKEYDKLKKFLKTIGETELYICENLGATVTDRKSSFKTIINLKEGYNFFQEKVREFEPPFGWFTNHFYVYGQNENWGIYICEFPTINIIGCKRDLSEEFRKVFLINGNGYADLKEFVDAEFQTQPDLLNNFLRHYQLEDSD